MKTVLLLIILQTFHVIYGQSGGCEQLQSNKCSSCLQLPGCAWCSAVNYTGSRCNKPKQHEEALCPVGETVTGDPDAKPTLEDMELTEKNQITPRKVSSKVRVGESIRFQVDIEPAENYPVDFYILMDLSASMAKDLENVKKLALNISAKLGQLTNRHRLGFGSFVDKVVPPYVKKEDIGKKYNGNDVPYDYKHVLSFTDKASEFRDRVSDQISSGNHDVPEGTFDALMQVAACEKLLGWNPQNETRRMVLIATDATFHIAGEGKFGGVVVPNDGKCWLGPENSKGVRLYTKSLELDYPSVNQVFQKLKLTGIQPIFAIGVDAAVDFTSAKDNYEALEKTWENIGATMGTLDSTSTNIIQLIEDSYNKITSRVSLNPASTPDGIDVKIASKCGSAATASENSCEGVKPGVKVSFDISVTATSCKYGNKSSFTLSAASFGSVEIELDIICSCDCENTRIANSSNCNGNGTLVCGSCECNEGRSGEECQCDAEIFTQIDPNLCKETNTTGSLICDGNGYCDCGVCKCNPVAGQKAKYYGKYCQCSNFNCAQFDNKLCGGPDRGVCECGRCKCNRGYVSENCGKDDCPLFVPRCLSEEENGVKVNCSGHGTCNCGKCDCDTFYEGQHCQRCLSCAGRCGDYRQCVLCKIFGVKPENETLCDDCPAIVKYSSLALLRKENFPTECSETDEEGCTYYYSYVNLKNVTVVHAVESKDCPEGADVLLIVLAVIGGIVGIGIILLILWKLLTAMVDRREYQKFEQDRAKSKWHREKNPLYQPATSTVQNPTFVGSKS